ncbi:MAG: GPP34 family phosphoprotein [Bacteroidales bacterium]
MAVFSVIGTVAGESLMDLIRTGKTPNLFSKEAWKRTECGSLGLSVEAPFPLKPDDLPLPEQTRLVIEEMHVYTSPSFRRMKIMASSIRYVPEVGQANLEGAAQGALAEMQAQEGVEDFTFSQEYIEEPGLSGFVQKGTYTLHGIEIEFQSIGYVQGLALHYVVVSYPHHDPWTSRSRNESSQVLKSVPFHRFFVLRPGKPDLALAFGGSFLPCRNESSRSPRERIPPHMNTNTAELFLLLIQHPDKARSHLPYHVRNIAYLGAIFLDLNHRNLIRVDAGRVVVQEGSSGTPTDQDPLPNAHSLVLDQIRQGSRPRRIRFWLSRLSRNGRRIKALTIRDMNEKHLLKTTREKFVVIPYSSTRLVNKMEQKKLLQDIRDNLFRRKVTDEDLHGILGLIDATRLYRLVCRDRMEIRPCKKKIREIIATEAVSPSVKSILKETRLAIVASMAGAAAAS